MERDDPFHTAAGAYKGSDDNICRRAALEGDGIRFLVHEQGCISRQYMDVLNRLVKHERHLRIRLGNARDVNRLR